MTDEEFPKLDSCPFCKGKLIGGNSYNIRRDARIYFCKDCRLADKILLTIEGKKKTVKHPLGINVLLYSDGTITPHLSDVFVANQKHHKPTANKKK